MNFMSVVKSNSGGIKNNKLDNPVNTVRIIVYLKDIYFFGTLDFGLGLRRWKQEVGQREAAFNHINFWCRLV